MTPSQAIILKRTDSNDLDFLALVAMLDKDLLDRYGDLQSTYSRYNHLLNLETVLVAYQDDTPVGCGCFKKFNDDAVEVKRMFVKTELRGKGIAHQILAGLEAWAHEKGFDQAVLETGNNQPEAIRLYEKADYKIIPNYGQYSGMETSICMRKAL